MERDQKNLYVKKEKKRNDIWRSKQLGKKKKKIKIK